MAKWFPRSSAFKTLVIDVAVTVDISARRSEVWDLIYSPENAVLLDHRVTRGFRAEGASEGPGDIHVFVVRRNGRDQVSAVEVVESSHHDFAVVRRIGDVEDCARHAFRLTEVPGGTRAEYRAVFSVPGSSFERLVRENKRDELQAYLDRVKLVAEGGWRAPGRHAAS